MTEETFSLKVLWTGNQKGGTINTESFNRSLLLVIENKPVIYGTSSLKEHKKRSNFTAEELFASSISMAYMLRFLELSTADGIDIIRYISHANIRIKIDPDGCIKITHIILQPEIITSVSRYIPLAETLAINAKNSCGLISQSKINIIISAKVSAVN